MKPTSQANGGGLLVFGAHPDDIEFGCGGIVAVEASAGRHARFVICSRGEAASHGTPEEREAEARQAAQVLGAAVEFIEMGGDAHLVATPQHAIALAGIIRRFRPAIVLAPTPVENQHPDHGVLGRLVRDACRLARFGGLAELRAQAPYAIGSLLYYAITVEGEPVGATPILIDISDDEVLRKWKGAMEAHATQHKTRNYVELQLTRARLLGLRAGVAYAEALYSSEPIVLDSMLPLVRSARQF